MNATRLPQYQSSESEGEDNTLTNKTNQKKIKKKQNKSNYLSFFKKYLLLIDYLAIKIDLNT